MKTFLLILLLGEIALAQPAVWIKTPFRNAAPFQQTMGTGISISQSNTTIYVEKPTDNSGSAARYWFFFNSAAGGATIHSLNGVELGHYSGSSWVSDEWMINALSGGLISEYAIHLTPTYGSSYNWVGNTHGYDFEDAISATVDGTPVTLADGLHATGKTLVLSRLSHFARTDISPVVLATNLTTYTFSPQGMIQVQKQITWLTNVSVDIAYPSMLSVTNNAINMVGGGSTASLTPLTLSDDNAVCNSQQWLAFIYWESNYAACDYFTDNGVVANWGNQSPSQTYFRHCIDQRGSPNFDKKIYLTRMAGVSPAETNAPNSVQNWTTWWNVIKAPNIGTNFN